MGWVFGGDSHKLYRGAEFLWLGPIQPLAPFGIAFDSIGSLDSSCDDAALLDQTDVCFSSQHVSEHHLGDFRLEHVPALPDLDLLGVFAVGVHIVLSHRCDKFSKQAADSRLFINVRVCQPS